MKFKINKHEYVSECIDENTPVDKGVRFCYRLALLIYNGRMEFIARRQQAKITNMLPRQIFD